MTRTTKRITKRTIMKQPRPQAPARTALSGGIAALSCLPAWAHEGHGMPGFAHWHASDVLGFVAGVAAIAAVIWFKGGK